MAAQGFFAKLLDPQLPRKSYTSSSSWVDVKSSKSTNDSGISDFLAKFSLDENSETILPFDPFVEANKEKKKEIAPFVQNGEPLEKVKTYPPPISCLKLFKKGKHCNYVSYNKDEEKYVVEDVVVPNHDLFHANREGGRLKLYLNIFDEEEKEEDADGEEEGDNDEEEETKGEDKEKEEEMEDEEEN